MDKMKVTYEAMLSLTAEMVWDEAIKKHRTLRIYEEIDRALAAGDENTFHQLTNELKTLQ
ncbi:IDEAL domain-containing protein [Paenibacillus sp. SC116]|uniref:IDEAL domain-containing protein n=1 Tax=Paenibacillus sp. SC116 TaxID=2968986 RepID=UPI00215A62F7|nr:IDEAL domain-containing protein [Paenibacillus sp. SC116]MCR8842944.1 IDEAL domain-containing protein [Paenibacillus sp. SC116]